MHSISLSIDLRRSKILARCLGVGLSLSLTLSACTNPVSSQAPPMADDTTASSSTTSSPNSPGQPQAAPTQTGWQLTLWESNGSPVTLAAAVPPSLLLENGQVSGFGGCNTFGGSYRLSGEQITFDPLQATQRGCDGPIMAQETQFFSALQAARQLTREGDRTLVLVYGEQPNGGRLVFTRK